MKPLSIDLRQPHRGRFTTRAREVCERWRGGSPSRPTPCRTTSPWSEALGASPRARMAGGPRSWTRRACSRRAPCWRRRTTERWTSWPRSWPSAGTCTGANRPRCRAGARGGSSWEWPRGPSTSGSGRPRVRWQAAENHSWVGFLRHSHHTLRLLPGTTSAGVSAAFLVGCYSLVRPGRRAAREPTMGTLRAILNSGVFLSPVRTRKLGPPSSVSSLS
jgi:hypothetical protein